ncbi:hypothetical protein [Antribacter gilvus]|uniref:hypothetical protein n=1 Tax=Antribacter gilvus TaxID=2304675 RepID=UPI000F7B2925|nr:hypothetical protein [Antribacter gilvus]
MAECSRCGNEVWFFPTPAGHRLTFEPEAFSDGTHATVERWYLQRDPAVAIHESTVLGVADRTGYVIRHRCRLGRSQVVDEGKDLTTDLALARRQGPFVRDVVLVPPHLAYTYRWPGSWAHIVERAFTALCGARMPDGVRTKPAERHRLKDMPACPACRRRMR